MCIRSRAGAKGKIKPRPPPQNKQKRIAHKIMINVFHFKTLLCVGGERSFRLHVMNAPSEESLQTVVWTDDCLSAKAKGIHSHFC